MDDLILEGLFPNADPIDFLVDDVSNTGQVAFVYAGSHNANSWKAATNAVYTVPVAKKLVVKQVFTDQNETDTARDARLFNVTDATEVVRRNSLPYASSVFLWSGDLATASKFPEVAASKQVRLEIWNLDTQKRSMLWIVKCGVEDA